jgi:hypothetical protein
MAVIMAHDIAIELLHSLGLQDQFVGSVTIEMNPGEIVVVKVTHFMTEEQSYKLKEMVKEYYLVERPKPPTFPEDRKG